MHDLNYQIITQFCIDEVPGSTENTGSSGECVVSQNHISPKYGAGMIRLTNSTQLFAHITNAPGVGGLRFGGNESSSFLTNSLCFRSSQSDATLGCDQSQFSRRWLVTAAANKLRTETIGITSVALLFDSHACQVTWERDAARTRQGGPKCHLWRPLMSLIGDYSTIHCLIGKTRQQLHAFEVEVRRRRRRHMSVPRGDLCK